MIRRVGSVRLRLALLMGILFLAGMVALYLAAQSYALVAANRSYDRVLAGSAISIAETLSVADGRISVDLPYASLDMLSAAPDDRVFYRVIGPDKRTVTGYDDLPVPYGGAARGTFHDPGLTRFFDAPYRGEEVRFVLLGREIALPGTRGWVWVQVGQTRRARAGLQHELVVGAVAPIILMTVLALLVVWFGISRALRPLYRIGEEMAGREPSDLRPITAPVPSELAPLINSLNGFMLRLQDNIDRLRVLIAYAAHQVRTPLAALLAQAQVSENSDPERLRKAIRRIERNASKLTRLVNQLLSDATVQHRSDVRQFETFDLLDIIAEAIHDSVPWSEDSDVRFTTAARSAPFVGDPIMLGEALKNLIHNALRHGRSDDGEVSIGLDAGESEYLITVEDRGPGIQTEHQERVFERFRRGKASAAGAGLGLAIVRQAIASHEGSVRLTNRKGGGLRVEIRLPRSGS